MRIFPKSTWLILISSLVSISLVVTSIPVRGLQTIAFLLLLIVITLLRKIFGAPTTEWKGISLVDLLLATLIVFAHVLVVSSGGFYSQFLVAIHLMTLGIGFFLGIFQALFFLGATVVLLLAHLGVDSNLQLVFKDDPWSIVLYLLSFFAILPIVYQLVNQYQIKGKLTEFLYQQIKVNSQRESSILHGLKEMVIVLNPNLNILSVNQAVRMQLQVTNTDLLFKDFFEVFPLIGDHGEHLTATSLGIDQVVRDLSARTKPGLKFSSKEFRKKISVDVQIRPIVNAENQIEQIVLVIRESQGELTTINEVSRPSQKFLEQVIGRLELAETQIHKRGLIQESRDLYGVRKSLLDLQLMRRVEKDRIKERSEITDICTVIDTAVRQRSDFAQYYDVLLSAEFGKDSGDSKESSPLVPKQLLIMQPTKSGPTCNASVDQYWFKELFNRVLDLAVFLSASSLNPQVTVRISDEPTTVEVEVISSYKNKIDESALYELGYGRLALSTMLKEASGMEGWLVQTMVNQLNIGWRMEALASDGVVFTIGIPKGPDMHEERDSS